MPPRKSSTGLIVGILVSGVALAVIVGVILMVAFRPQESNGPTIDVTPPPAPPSTQPSSPGGGSTTQGGGSGQTVGVSGMTITVPDGWSVDTEKSNYVAFTTADGHQVFVNAGAMGSSAAQSVDKYHNDVLGTQLTSPKVTPAETVEINMPGLEAAEGGIAGTLATSKGSTELTAHTVGGRNTAKSTGILVTLIWPSSDAVSDAEKEQYSAVINELLGQLG